MAKKTKSKPVSQAALQALVRFRPQFQALNELATEAAQTRASTISGANTVAAAVRASLEGSRAPTAGVYDTQLGKQAEINAGLKADLSGLTGPMASAIRAAGLSEAAGATSQLGTARTRAQQDITDQVGRVGAGQQQAVLQAGSKYADDLDKIGRSRKDLAAQLGDFTEATQAKLDDATQKQLFTSEQNDLNRRVSLAKSGINPDTGVYDPTLKPPKTKSGGAGKTVLPGGAKLGTAEQHGSARDSIQSATAAIKAQLAADPKATRAELAADFINGRPAETVKRRLTSAEIKAKQTDDGQPLT